MRYREKKLRRLDSNTIRYMKRKINADKRPRCAHFRKPAWTGESVLLAEVHRQQRHRCRGTPR